MELSSPNPKKQKISYIFSQKNFSSHFGKTADQAVKQKTPHNLG